MLEREIVAAEPDLRRYFRDIGNAIFSKGECGRTGIVMPALALESRCTEMTAQCQEKAKSMAAPQRRLLAGCFSLFLLAVPGCYLPLVPVKKRGFLRPRHASWLYFCGIYSGISDARALQRRIRQARARACSNAAQTRRWAFIASSTAGTMPKKAWIIPGNSLYSTGTPARRSASAYR